MIGRLHYEIVRSLLDEGACPANAELERRLGITDAALESLIAEAAAGHALVPHPHVAEPWVVHPFSLTPTLNWVEGPTHGWWAPCIWCAFGIAALAGGRVSIHTRIGAEREPLVIPVKGGESETTEDLCVHFAIPRRARGITCTSIARWCSRSAAWTQSATGAIATINRKANLFR